MKLTKFTVAFDDGHTVTTQLKSRDLAIAERDGIDLEAELPIRGTYTLAFLALQRMKRNGDIDFEIPADVDGLMDVADIEPVEDDDPEGKGSGQDPEPGSQQN